MLYLKIFHIYCHPVYIYTYIYNFVTEYLYHYTDAKGIQGIQDTKTIRSSKSGKSRDAHFGTGVYLTALGPDESDETIVKNNFGQFFEKKANRVRYYIRFLKSDLPRATKEYAGGRDVYIFKTPIGIDLNNVPHDIAKR